jgi:hypothetical protein
MLCYFTDNDVIYTLIPVQVGVAVTCHRPVFESCPIRKSVRTPALLTEVFYDFPESPWENSSLPYGAMPASFQIPTSLLFTNHSTIRSFVVCDNDSLAKKPKNTVIFTIIEY